MSRCSAAPCSRHGSILIVIRVLRGVEGEALSRMKHEVKIGTMLRSVYQYSQKENTSWAFLIWNVQDYKCFGFYIFLKILKYLHIHDIAPFMKEKFTSVSSTRHASTWRQLHPTFLVNLSFDSDLSHEVKCEIFYLCYQGSKSAEFWGTPKFGFSNEGDSSLVPQPTNRSELFRDTTFYLNSKTNFPGLN